MKYFTKRRWNYFLVSTTFLFLPCTVQQSYKETYTVRTVQVTSTYCTVQVFVQLRHSTKVLVQGRQNNKREDPKQYTGFVYCFFFRNLHRTVESPIGQPIFLPNSFMSKFLFFFYFFSFDLWNCPVRQYKTMPLFSPK